MGSTEVVSAMSTAMEQAREAVMKAFLPSIPRQIEANIAADAASDIWEPLLRHYGQHRPGCPQGMFGENKCNCGLWEVLGDAT